MPNFDRTGPSGFGPMTGRGMGQCARDRGFGGRCGRGMGFGWFGMRNWFSNTNETDSLKEEKKYLQEDLKNIEKRLEEMKDK